MWPSIGCRGVCVPRQAGWEAVEGVQTDNGDGPKIFLGVHRTRASSRHPKMICSHSLPMSRADSVVFQWLHSDREDPVEKLQLPSIKAQIKEICKKRKVVPVFLRIVFVLGRKIIIFH